MDIAKITSRMTAGVLLATALQVLDLVTFQIAVGVFGIHAENNTLMGILYLQWGFFGLVLGKLALIGFLIFSLGVYKTQRGRNIATALVGAAGLLGAAVNMAAVLVAG